MTETDGAIGIHVVTGGVLGLYLQRSAVGSDVSGYAVSKGGPPNTARVIKVLRALKLPESTPIAIAWDESSLSADVRHEIFTELEQAGYRVTTEGHQVAAARSLPENQSTTGAVELVHCQVPASLLTAHPTLTARGLAGAAGAALGVLGLGRGTVLPGTGATSGTTAPKTVATLDASAAPPAPPAPLSKSRADGAPPAPPAPIASGTNTGSESADPTLAAPISPSERVASLDGSRTPASPAADFRPWMIFLLLGSLLFVGIVLGMLTSSDEVATPPVATPEATATTEPTAAPAPTAAPEPTPTPQATATPGPTATPTPVPDYPPLSELPDRAAIFRPPTLLLQGPVQDQATIDAIYERAVEVFGETNVINDYVVHPDAPSIDDGIGMQIEAAVLFESGSVDIGPDFIPALDLGVLLFQLNPQMTAVIEGHTDLVGGLLPNQVLSERRARAVRNYLVSQGVDPESVTAIGRGSSDPVADNETDEGRQRNRRIEFALTGLLDPRPE